MGILFGYVSLAITILIIWFMPKRITRKEIYITWGWIAAITVYSDLVFGLILDLYDFVEPEMNFLDLLLQATLPPSFGIIFINFLPRKRRQFIAYLVAVVIISLFYEWLSLLTGYLVYKGWKLWYSAPFYLFGMIYLRWHLSYLRKHAEPREGAV